MNTFITIAMTQEQFQQSIRNIFREELKGVPVPQQENEPTLNKVPANKLYQREINDKPNPFYLMSKPTFYSYVKSGKIKLHKLGSRSFVDLNEVDRVFHQTQIVH